jgi:hypothetical protein
VGKKAIFCYDKLKGHSYNKKIKDKKMGIGWQNRKRLNRKLKKRGNIKNKSKKR